jgi:hypothetical protein
MLKKTSIVLFLALAIALAGCGAKTANQPAGEAGVRLDHLIAFSSPILNFKRMAWFHSNGHAWLQPSTFFSTSPAIFKA